MYEFIFCVIGFVLGFFISKKSEQIKIFFRSMKYLYGITKEKQIYNEFFETNFSESDYSKERIDSNV